MKKYRYNEPEYDKQGNMLDSDPKEITEEQILSEYWDYWSGQMIKKYGKDHHLITKQNCIEDWIIVNWAWEVKDD